MIDQMFDTTLPIRVIRGSCRRPGSVFGVSGLVVSAAERAEQDIELRIQGMCEGMPSTEGADSAPLFDLDDRASPQAAAGCELVVAPPAGGPQTR